MTAVHAKTKAYTTAEIITPHDSNAQGNLTARGGCDALWIGGAGNIALVIGGATVLLSGVPAGTLLPVSPTRVNATNTSATLIAALWY